MYYLLAYSTITGKISIRVLALECPKTLYKHVELVVTVMFPARYDESMSYHPISFSGVYANLLYM
jgi:hypothetical protein